MVTFLSKPAESEGFEQIVDFLNAHPIRYALTVNPTIYVSCIEQFWSFVVAKTINGEVQLHALVDGKRIVITETSVRRSLRLADAEGIDCFSNYTIFENLALMGPKTTAWNEFSSTMASVIICLATNQKFNFSKLIIDSMVRDLDNLFSKFLMYPRELIRMDTEITQSSGPTENIADEVVHKERGDSLVRVATTASSLEAEQDSGNIDKTQSKATLNEPSFSRTSSGNTPRSGEDSLKLNALMELCTNLQQRILDLETTKTTQANEVASLKRRVKKLEKKDKSRTHKLKRLYKVGLSARVESSGDEEDLVNDDNEIFDVDALASEEVFVAEQSENVVEKVVDAAQTITTKEITLAQALAELKSAKPKADKPVVEQVKPMKRLEQTRLDEELAFKLQAEEEEERLAREKAQQIEESNIAWDDVQAKVEAEYQLAQRLQAQDQEELTYEENARLFVQFLEQRKKHFAAKRAEEKRNRPPTRAQQRNIMVNTFVDYRTELMEESSKKAETELEYNLKKAEAEVIEGSSKRAGEELEQKSIKKQKIDKDKETAELQSLMQVISDEEEVAIDVVPSATKPPTIVD
ncbi:hypothetical protein Tco_0974798 [Tanacetum coccineum]|uniref:Xylulose kinase-1 n=1 Tax=Tanacetum coccineum TaxID=301880 RepID=A0ABQ5ECS6_9ASTR